MLNESDSVLSHWGKMAERKLNIVSNDTIDLVNMSRKRTLIC